MNHDLIFVLSSMLTPVTTYIHTFIDGNKNMLNSKYQGYQSTKYAGKQSLASALKESQSSRRLSQQEYNRNISCSQTSQEDSSWDTATTKSNRLDDAIARNRHSGIMSTLKGIESVLSKMSDSLMRMAIAMDECASSICNDKKTIDVFYGHASGVKRKSDIARTSSSNDLFAVNLVNDVISVSDTECDEIQLDKYMANKRIKRETALDMIYATNPVINNHHRFTLNAARKQEQDSQATQLPPEYCQKPRW